MKSKFITCIFVNYNNSLESVKCVESILNSIFDHTALKIFIVDNNSSDKEKKILRDFQNNKSSSFEIIFHEKNIGYFPAINHIYETKIGYIQKSDYVIIGNNDLLFNEDFFIKLNNKDYFKDIFVVSPNIINSDSNHQNPQIIYKYSKAQLLFLDLFYSSYFVATFLNLISQFIKFRGSQTSKVGYNESQYISIGYGACYILTRGYILNVGNIPSYLFLMNEENALTNAVLEANGRIYYDSDLIVNHLEHSAINISPKRKIYKIAQDSYKLSKKHFNNRYLYDKKLIKND